MNEEQAQQIEKKIIALESQIFSLRSEFERLKREKKISITGQVPTTQIPRIETTPRPQPADASGVASAHGASFSWEWLIGGNIIGKAGIITLILSTALFMVYALDQGWLSEWIRLLMLQAAFAGFGYGSYKLYRKSYKYVPEILAIAAVSANTIAIYSAHFVYRFLGRTETICMMFAVLCLSLFFALHIQSAALSMIMFGGFFALPVIHSRGINEPKSYFLFLLAVNMLYLLLRLRENKRETQTSAHAIWVVALGNALSVLGWVGAFNQYATAALFFCAISLVILLFVAHTIHWPQQQRPFLEPFSILLINTLAAVMTLSVLSTNKIFLPEARAIAIACIGAINMLVVHILPPQQRHTPAAALSVVLASSAAIAIVHDGNLLHLLQALLLSLAMYIAGRSGDRLLFVGTAIANGINLLLLLATLNNGSENRFLFNLQAAGLFFYAVAAFYLRLNSIYPSRLPFGPILTAVALLSSLIGIITELQRIVTSKDARLLMLTLVFLAYAVVLLLVGFRRQKVWFRQAGLVFLGLAILKFYLIDIWQWNTAIRIIAGILMGGGLVVTSFYYEKFRDKFRELGVLLLCTGLIIPINQIEAAEKFHPNRYRYAKVLVQQAGNLAGKKYGSVVIDGEIYKSAGEYDLRLVYDGKIVPYIRKVSKNAHQEKLEKEIAFAELISSVDGENASVYMFENRERARISGLRLAFEESDYNRAATLNQRAGRLQSETLIKSLTLTRKAGKPDYHTVDFEAISGELKLTIQNEDDEPLTLTRFTIFSESERLLFRLPENFGDSKKPLKLYYGADYAQKPKFDLDQSAFEGQEIVEFRLQPQEINPDFKLTLFDPPYSVWFFRVVFWLLIALIGWRMYSVYNSNVGHAGSGNTTP